MTTNNDSKRHNFVIVDSEVLQDHGAAIGPNGFAVYGVLLVFAQGKNTCYPAVATIAAMLGCGQHKVRDGLKKLEAAGLIESQKRYDDQGQASNRYVVLPVTKRPRQSPAQESAAVATDRATPEPADTLATAWQETFGKALAAADRATLLEAAGGDIDAVIAAAEKVTTYRTSRGETVFYPVKAVQQELGHRAKPARKTGTKSTRQAEQPAPPASRMTREAIWSLTAHTGQDVLVDEDGIGWQWQESQWGNGYNVGLGKVA